MSWAARPFFDGEYVTVFSVPGLKYKWVKTPDGFIHDYVTEEGWDLEHTPPPPTEQEVAIQTFAEMLRAATSDGGRKRAAGLKPPWWRDGGHEAAVFSHLAKRKRGEMVDPDSGAHPYVHAAWRLLAIAYQETYGTVDPARTQIGSSRTHSGNGDSEAEPSIGPASHPAAMGTLG